MPQDVYGKLKSKMTEDAFRVFELGTKSPQLYDHAADTWNGVTHKRYNQAMRELWRAG